MLMIDSGIHMIRNAQLEEGFGGLTSIMVFKIKGFNTFQQVILSLLNSIFPTTIICRWGVQFHLNMHCYMGPIFQVMVSDWNDPPRTHGHWRKLPNNGDTPLKMVSSTIIHVVSLMLQSIAVLNWYR